MMRKARTLPLATRMLLVVLLPLLLVALAITGFLLQRYLVDQRTAQLARSAALASQMQDAAGFALFIGDTAELNRLASSLLRNDPLARRVRIDDADGTNRASAVADGSNNASLMPGQQRQADLPVLRAAAPRVDPYLDTPGTAVASPAPLGRIVIEYDDSPIEREYLRLLRVAIIVAAIAVAFGIALALMLARSISRPLLSVSRTVARISSGDLRARVTENDAGVLESLATGINDMAGNLASAHDELQQRIAEATAEMRQQRDAAERATAAKSRFLAAASHDLRQPLQALGLFVLRLRQPQSPEQLATTTTQIESAMVALQEKFASLLDLSQLEGEGIRVRRASFEISRVIHPVMAQLRPVAETRGLTLRCRGGDTRVDADPALLERIVLNLVSNALKYTDHGGVIVSVRRLRGRVRLAVWDTGKGIAPEDQAQVFDEYVQVGNAERAADQGVGIGLSICRRLAMAMDTTIGLRSWLGRGSVFWINLPIGAAPVRGETDVVADGPLALLIDPDGNRADALAARLGAWGVVSHQASSATAAVDVLAGERDVNAVLCHVDALSADTSGALIAALATQNDQTLRVAVGASGIDALPAACRGLFAACLAADAPPGRLRALFTRPA